jgi:hypothetical protein
MLSLSSSRRLARAALALALSSTVVASHAAAQVAPAAADIERRVDALVAQMTLDEKIDYLGGTDWFFVRAVPRLKIPALRMATAPGVRTRPAPCPASHWPPRGIPHCRAGVNSDRARGATACRRTPAPPAASIRPRGIRGVQSQGVSAVKHFVANNSG